MQFDTVAPLSLSGSFVSPIASDTAQALMQPIFSAIGIGIIAFFAFAAFFAIAALISRR